MINSRQEHFDSAVQMLASDNIFLYFLPVRQDTKIAFHLLGAPAAASQHVD